MALQPNELFVADSFVRHFGKKYKYEEGENPPDIYLISDSEKVAVEITRLSEISFNQEGKIQNRVTEDSFGLRVCDTLKSTLTNYIPKGMSFKLVLRVPVENPKKYKKDLYNFLKKLCSQNMKIGDKFCDSKLDVDVKIISAQYGQEKIICYVVNKNSNSDILHNAEIILKVRILDKIKKCEKIISKGSVWLALYNGCVVAEEKTYVQAFKNISTDHSFEKIFLVSNEGVIRQLS